MSFDQLAPDDIIEKAVAALKNNGVNAEVVVNGAAATSRVLQLIPEGAEVFTLQSITIHRNTDIGKILDESGKYNSVRKKLSEMDRATQGLEMNKLGAVPDYAASSVHAVTYDGQILIASNTGSQLGADAYGASHLIFVVGTQKIVTNLDEGFKRIYEYILPLESERLSRQIGKPIQSYPSKILIINREIKPDRTTLIFVKEKLGF